MRSNLLRILPAITAILFLWFAGHISAAAPADDAIPLSLTGTPTLDSETRALPLDGDIPDTSVRADQQQLPLVFEGDPTYEDWCRTTVISQSDSEKEPARAVPSVFRWPTREALLKQDGKKSPLRPVPLETGVEFARWISAVLSFDLKGQKSIELHEEDAAVSYFLPPGTQAAVRFVRNRQDKTRRWPIAVQVLQDAEHSAAALDALAKQLAEGTADQPSALGKLEMIDSILKSAPISNALSAAKWQLREYSRELDWERIFADFSCVHKSRPLRMRISVGPHGSMIQLSGLALETLVKEKTPRKPAGPSGNDEAVPPREETR